MLWIAKTFRYAGNVEGLQSSFGTTSFNLMSFDYARKVTTTCLAGKLYKQEKSHQGYYPHGYAPYLARELSISLARWCAQKAELMMLDREYAVETSASSSSSANRPL